MITIGDLKASPIVVSLPEGTPEEPIADCFASFFPGARITVVARPRQTRAAIGATGTHNRADVVTLVTELLGSIPDGATLATIITPAPAPPIDSTSAEIIRVALSLGYVVHDARDVIDLPAEEALAVLSECAPDELLARAVALCL